MDNNSRITETIVYLHTYRSDNHLKKPGFHKANYDHDKDRFQAKTKRLMWKMTAQPHIRFVFCVVVAEFAVNGNHAQAWAGRTELQYSEKFLDTETPSTIPKSSKFCALLGGKVDNIQYFDWFGEHST